MQKIVGKRSLRQMIRFGIVGTFNTLVDYGIFYILLSWVHLNKGVSQVIATGVAMCGSFLFNRYWTFERNGRGNFGEIVKFFITNLIAMLTVILMTYLFYDVLHAERAANAVLSIVGISPMLAGDLAVMFCKVLASVFSIVINFLGNKFWVFGSKNQTETEV